MMKIVHVSTYDNLGGAAIAAYRLCKALNRAGHDSIMIVKNKGTTDAMVFSVNPERYHETSSPAFRFGKAIQQYLNWKKKDPETALFSFPYPGYDLSGLEVVRKADIIHIHWTEGFLSPYTLASLLSLGKKVVFTCHDQRIFTGGCHCLGGCRKYIDACSNCNQMTDDSFQIPLLVQRDAETLLKEKLLHFITPSRWLKTLVNQSALFKNHSVAHIPNSVETDVFSPMDKAAARKEIGIDETGLIFLFGASDINQKIKGLDHLKDAFGICLNKLSDNSGSTQRKKIVLVTFGYNEIENFHSDIGCISLGYISTQTKLNLIYSSADYYCLPSLEDNLPNTMLEAMSCGIPIIGYETGGIPEMVVHGETGLLAATGNKVQLSDCLFQAILETVDYQHMSSRCREAILNRCSAALQLKDHLELYQKLLDVTEEEKGSSFFSHDQELTVPISFKMDSGLGSFMQRIETDAATGKPGKDTLFILSLMDMKTTAWVDELPASAVPHLFLGVADMLKLFDDLQYIEGAGELYSQAVPLCRALTENSVEDALLVNFASLYQNCNNLGLRLDAYDAVLRLVPFNSRILYDKGATLRAMERLDEALEVLAEAASQKDHFYVHVKSLEGAIFRDLGNYHRALESFSHALACEPGNTEILEKQRYVQDKIQNQIV